MNREKVNDVLGWIEVWEVYINEYVGAVKRSLKDDAAQFTDEELGDMECILEHYEAIMQKIWPEEWAEHLEEMAS